MRILRIGFVFIQDAHDATTWSGIPFQVLNQLRAVQGIEVEVFSPLDSRIKYLLAPMKLLAKLRGQSISLDHFPLVQRSYAQQIESLLRSRPVDVIVSMSSIPIALLRCSQPIVVWADAVFHSMFDYYGDTFSNLPKAAVTRGKLQEETALHRCAIAAYASTWALDSAKRIIGGDKVRLLPFGSSIPVRHTERDIADLAKRKRETRNNQCELLFVGVDWERKGGQIAVETARLLNEGGVKTRLRVVGFRPETPLPDYVEVLGFINKNTKDGVERIAALYREADFFILPTKAEAAGVVFCEASSFGLPSFTYATGGVTDYIRNGHNGECLPLESSPAEFATRIRRLLSTPAEYEALCVRAFQEYKNRLNWEKSVGELINYCHELAALETSSTSKETQQVASYS
jgi:glycosyltransferase involved in cell wall biosynthesis